MFGTSPALEMTFTRFAVLSQIARLGDSRAVASQRQRSHGGKVAGVMIEFKGSHFERDVIYDPVGASAGITWPIRSATGSSKGNDGLNAAWRLTIPRSIALGAQIRSAAGDGNSARASVPVRIQLAIGRDVCEGQGRLEMPMLTERSTRYGATVDFLLTAKLDCKAPRFVFLLQGDGRCNGHTLKSITIDKSGANTARQSEATITDHKAGIEMRQIKYLNNIVEQDHRGHQATESDRCSGSNHSGPQPLP